MTSWRSLWERQERDRQRAEGPRSDADRDAVIAANQKRARRNARRAREVEAGGMRGSR